MSDSACTRGQVEDAGCAGERMPKRGSGIWRPACAPLPWAFVPSLPSLQERLHWARAEESATCWLPNTILGSCRVFPGRDFSPTVDKWGTKAQSCGEGKVFAHLDLGWSCVLLVTFSLSPTYFSQLFCFFFFFLLKKTCKFLEGVPHLPTRVSPISKTVPLTGHKPVRNLQLCSCYRKGA